MICYENIVKILLTWKWNDVVSQSRQNPLYINIRTPHFKQKPPHRLPIVLNSQPQWHSPSPKPQPAANTKSKISPKPNSAALRLSSPRSKCPVSCPAALNSAHFNPSKAPASPGLSTWRSRLPSSSRPSPPSAPKFGGARVTSSLPRTTLPPQLPVIPPRFSRGKVRAWKSTGGVRRRLWTGAQVVKLCLKLLENGEFNYFNCNSNTHVTCVGLNSPFISRYNVKLLNILELAIRKWWILLLNCNSNTRVMCELKRETEWR